ncbi:hypothetical protein NA56DRAFT_710403 [Hyaloscypha hepaticicola]|uniref:Uncharacterized protein n=1 Tax=Hyaloscypha hepaticicola TaxID=2082293 RepID=A0A2J6PLL6_9HELO|nr:hypothetical protein NA56DRAFT_710403 [Hyaloscypha hepaticicola]
MLLVDFREPPPPSAVAPDVQHACLSVLYLCGYCESANLVEFTAERQGGAVAAGGFGPVLDKHTPPSVHCAPAAFWAEGQNASTPRVDLRLHVPPVHFEGSSCTRYRIHVLSPSNAIWGAQRRASDPRSRDSGQGQRQNGRRFVQAASIHPDRGSQLLQD